MKRSAVVGIALSFAAAASANPPRATTVVVGDVRIEGVAQASSTTVPDEPRFTLHNRGAVARTVVLVALTSLGEGDTRIELPILEPRTVTLAPHARRTIDVRFDGRALPAGGGLPFHRFALRVAVGREEGVAVASNAYICRIPMRRKH